MQTNVPTTDLVTPLECANVLVGGQAETARFDHAHPAMHLVISRTPTTLLIRAQFVQVEEYVMTREVVNAK